MVDGRAREVFLEVHRDLPRQGPGNRESTARALATLDSLPARPRVLDVGCGPGLQTGHLAELLPEAAITAVDLYQQYLDEAHERLSAAGVVDRVTLLQADMRQLPFEPASFDLIWCEGAAYIMGVEVALTGWRKLLQPGGAVGFTDAVWLVSDRPRELDDWWQAGYPDMGDRVSGLNRVEKADFSVADSFVLPEAAWWDDYYVPMEARLSRLRGDYPEDDVAVSVFDECQREIDYYRRWSDCYGYLFVTAVAAEE